MSFLNSTQLMNAVFAIGILLVGYFLSRHIQRLVEKSIKGFFSRHHTMLITRGIFYLLFTVFAVAGLQHLGFNLSVLLGAAGVFTVAISFASQTAASNLISGVFLLFERPFKVGDNVEVNGISGVVESIDLMSTKLKTGNNTLVRIPNETLIKSSITNLNYFSMRRLDLTLSVAYNTNIEKVKHLLLNIAAEQNAILKDPEPSVVINLFADSAIELKFMVWVENANATLIKNQLQEIIKHRFDDARIEMPYPQMIIHQA